MPQRLSEKVDQQARQIRRRSMVALILLALVVLASQIVMQGSIGIGQIPAQQLSLLLAAIALLLTLAVGLIFAPTSHLLKRLSGEQGRRQAEMETLFATNPTALFLVDQQSLDIARCNRAAENLIGASVAEIVQQPVGAFLDPMHEISQRFLETMRAGGETPADCEVTLLDASHSSVEAQVCCSRLTFNDRPAYLMAMTNITEAKKAQEALHYHATFDDMTHLVNRRTGLLLLEKEMARSQRDTTPLVVCFVDLDGLKGVNDQFGTEEGDWLIMKAAEVLADSIRLGDEAIRLGGDEFLLVLHNCTSEGSQILLQRIEESMIEISANAQKPFTLRASMGLAIYDPDRHTQVHQLIAEADRRMFLKKQARKASFSEMP